MTIITNAHQLVQLIRSYKSHLMLFRVSGQYNYLTAADREYRWIIESLQYFGIERKVKKLHRQLVR